MGSMRKILALFIILFLTMFSLAASQASESRGVTIKLKDAGGKEISLYKESHALVIGVSNYTAGWPKLSGVKKDVEEAKTALEKQGFNVTVVSDPSREQLI